MMKITMQKLNMVKYAQSEVDVEKLKKKGFQVVGNVEACETAEEQGEQALMSEEEEEASPSPQPKRNKKKKDEADGESG